MVLEFWTEQAFTLVKAIGIPLRAVAGRETGPYKDNEVRGTYDSPQVVSSTAFQQGPLLFTLAVKRTHATCPRVEPFMRKVSVTWPTINLFACPLPVHCATLLVFVYSLESGFSLVTHASIDRVSFYWYWRRKLLNIGGSFSLLQGFQRMFCR